MCTADRPFFTQGPHPSSTSRPSSSKKGSKKQAAATPPLPCTPLGYRLLVGVLQTATNFVAAMATLLGGRQLELLLEGWRMLDWMDLGLSSPTTVGGFLRCLANLTMLPGSLRMPAFETSLLRLADGPRLRLQLIDEVSFWHQQHQDCTMCCATAPISARLLESVSGGWEWRVN